MKLSNIADAFLFPNRLLFSQRTDSTGGIKEQHIVYMIDRVKKKKKVTKMPEGAIQKERETESSQFLG